MPRTHHRCGNARCTSYCRRWAKVQAVPPVRLACSARVKVRQSARHWVACILLQTTANLAESRVPEPHDLSWNPLCPDLDLDLVLPFKQTISCLGCLVAFKISSTKAPRGYAIADLLLLSHQLRNHQHVPRSITCTNRQRRFINYGLVMCPNYH